MLTLFSRFAHDRYMQASIALRECHNTVEMHFVIAQTMMKYVRLPALALVMLCRTKC